MALKSAEAGAMSPGDMLAVLFASKARAALLQRLLLDPSRAYYQRQLAQETGLTLRSVQRELERLARMELVFQYTEGNRLYCQVDPLCPLFGALRALVAVGYTPLEQLRAEMAASPAVRLAFLHPPSGRVLAVTHGDAAPRLEPPAGFEMQSMAAEAFAAAVSRRSESLSPFLLEGVDLLGRREDVLWRRMERAGYAAPKAEGVS